MPPSLLGNDVNLVESGTKRRACWGTSLETLDPAIVKAPTPRQLMGQDSEAQRGDENPPRAGLQEKQGPESEPRALHRTSRIQSLAASVSPSPHGHVQVWTGLPADSLGRQEAIPRGTEMPGRELTPSQEE